MVTIIHMAIMRHFENRMNKQKNTNSATSADAVHPKQNININATAHCTRSPFGSTTLTSLASKHMSDKGTVRTRMSKKWKASSAPVSDELAAGVALMQVVEDQREMFGDTDVGDMVTDAEQMRFPRSSQAQPDDGQQQNAVFTDVVGGDADMNDGQSSSVPQDGWLVMSGGSTQLRRPSSSAHPSRSTRVP